MCVPIVGDTKVNTRQPSHLRAFGKYGAGVVHQISWVDGHGNFGSVGDGAAGHAMANGGAFYKVPEMLADIGKNVDFTPNFDETEKEPVVLPPD